jgi:antibiotic biosynthesis monooxygenase (ABM) superfamily enzyme
VDAFPCRPRRLRTLARRLPTLTVLNLALSSVLQDVPIVLRTLVLATVAVPIVMYGLMPRLHRLRVRLLVRRAG